MYNYLLGYKFTVSGETMVYTEPPKLEVIDSLVMFSNIKSMALMSLQKLLKNYPSFQVASLMQPLVDCFTIPLMHKGKSDAGAGLTRNKTIVVESSHPYSNSQDTFETVSIPGAAKLMITFDEQSQTEHGCDFIRFYPVGHRQDSNFFEGAHFSGGLNGNSGKNMISECFLYTMNPERL